MKVGPVRCQRGAVHSPLVRHGAGPVLTADGLPDDDMVLVLNPGVVALDGRYLMAYRVDRGVDGDPYLLATDIGFAWSDDGVAWTPEPRTAFPRERAIELLAPLEPHRRLDDELWRIYDPRLTALDGEAGDPRLVMTFAADTTHGLRAGLARSDDGHHWEALGLGPPDNRNHVVFPRRVDGRWLRLERPMHEYGTEALGAGRYGVWLSRSPDLVHWGDHRFVLDRGSIPFANDKVGPGAPPVLTDRGWLCILHAVTVLDAETKRGWEDGWGKEYRAAAVLLDVDDPSRVVAAATVPLLDLDPSVDHEQSGFRHGVIFPTAAVARPGAQGDELWVYYGAADTAVGLATGLVSDVVDFVIAHADPSTVVG